MLYRDICKAGYFSSGVSIPCEVGSFKGLGFIGLYKDKTRVLEKLFILQMVHLSIWEQLARQLLPFK